MPSAGEGDPAPRDDRVLPVTRGVAAAIVPFLLVAAVLLFGFPARTGELFAWAIAPPLSAALLASAYVGGIWFFVRVATVRAWHRVQHGFPAVVVFAAALLVATLLHLDRFSQNLSFVVWMLLYATTPFVVAAVAAVQRRYASREPAASEVFIPRAAAIALVAIGGAALLTGAAMFVAPALAIGVWGWELTPLTAQVTGAVLSLTGVVGAALLVDRRWSAFRVVFEAQLVSLAAIGVSLAVHAGDLRGPLAGPFVVLVAGAFAAYAALFVACETAARRAAR